MPNSTSDALQNIMIKVRDPDQKKAKDFTTGAQQPQTLAEGYQNIKNAFGFGGDEDDPNRKKKD